VEYHEGEKFISKSNPCYECLCHKDFDNTTIIEKNSHCHKLNCEIELKYKSFIQRGCLPIFENDKCCPVDWKCFDCEYLIYFKTTLHNYHVVSIKLSQLQKKARRSSKDHLMRMTRVMRKTHQRTRKKMMMMRKSLRS
jgi:hypothetical protein